MNVSVIPRTRVPMAAPLSEGGEIEKGRDWADLIKRRSTLVGLVQPIGITMGLASDAAVNLDALQTIGGSLLHGELSRAGDELTRMVDRAMHPDGISGAIYGSGLGLRAGVDGLVGGLELWQGIRNKDKFLGLMGTADLVSGASQALLAAGVPLVAIGLSVAASISKTALVMMRPDQYSRIQKMKTFFDATGTVSSSLLKGGLLVGPALAVGGLLGATQMLYMNHEGFRNGLDRWIDKLLRRQSPTELIS